MGRRAVALGAALGLLVPCFGQVAAPAAPLGASGWAQREFDALAGGNFAEAPNLEAGPLAWWRASGSGVAWEPGSAVLQPGAWIEQPVAGFFDAVRGGRLRIEGDGACRVELRGSGAGVLILEEQLGAGALAELELAPVETGPSPRFVLRLSCPAEAAGALRVERAELLLPLPAPSLAELRARAAELLEWGFEPWFERALDEAGPRRTAFITRDFDALDGRALGEPRRRATLHPIYSQLLIAQNAAPRPEWRAALERFLEDYLTLGLHAETGLPQFWDGTDDVALPEQPMEIGLHLEFLGDVAERGPEVLRARALAAAKRIAETVLARGILPDGSVAAKYRPADAQPFTQTVALRRLDVPAQLVRIGGLLGDARFLAPAREAVLRFEYDHLWPGSWRFIDPGFDDMYGHYGARTATMWAAAPAESSFRAVALGGFEFYAPLWRDALRHGGNVAADQVRCWKIAIELARIDTALAPRVGELLWAASQVHWNGQQDAGGRWVDVTVVGFDPQILPVGDTAGVPQNQLEGLAAMLAAAELLGYTDDQRALLRARAAALIERSLEAFAGPYGLIPGSRRDAGGSHPAVGTIRLFGGLVELLDAGVE